MRVRVPASIANFGPGFDVFGVGIEKPYDKIKVREADEWRIKVSGFSVPEDETNVALISAKTLAGFVGEDIRLEIKLKKGIRPKSGLGSSGASSLAGALASALVLGIEKDEVIIKAALEGEKSASGLHADNVVPSYYGDFTIIESIHPLRVHRIPVDFQVAVVLPEVEVLTHEARSLIPNRIPTENAVRNVALASALVKALMEENLTDVGRLLQDTIAFPYRRTLLPWFDKVKKAALDAGAYGLFVSGSGPAVFALGEDLRGIGKSIVEAFLEMGIKAELYITTAGRGAEWK